MYSVYLLRNSKNQIYVDSSSNIQERILRHDTGQGAEFTKRNKNFKLVYEENYSTPLEARRKEKQIKEWRRERKKI